MHALLGVGGLLAHVPFWAGFCLGAARHIADDIGLRSLGRECSRAANQETTVAVVEARAPKKKRSTHASVLGFGGRLRYNICNQRSLLMPHLARARVPRIADQVDESLSFRVVIRVCVHHGLVVVRGADAVIVHQLRRKQRTGQKTAARGVEVNGTVTSSLWQGSPSSINCDNP